MSIRAGGDSFKTSLTRATGVFVWICSISVSSVADDDATYGALVLQSPVQAVASLNGKGAFLVIPGQDLRWGQIRPGTYRVSMNCGAQQWQQNAVVNAGETATVVASLASPGAPLSATVLPPPTPAATPAGRPSRATPPPPVLRPPAPLPPVDSPSTSTPSQKEVSTQQQEDEQRRQRELLREEREYRAAEERQRAAELRTQREQERQEQEAQEALEKSRKPRRPKVH